MLPTTNTHPLSDQPTRYLFFQGVCKTKPKSLDRLRKDNFKNLKAEERTITVAALKNINAFLDSAYALELFAKDDGSFEMLGEVAVKHQTHEAGYNLYQNLFARTLNRRNEAETEWAQWASGGIHAGKLQAATTDTFERMKAFKKYASVAKELHQLGRVDLIQELGRARIGGTKKDLALADAICQFLETIKGLQELGLDDLSQVLDPTRTNLTEKDFKLADGLCSIIDSNLIATVLPSYGLKEEVPRLIRGMFEEYSKNNKEGPYRAVLLGATEAWKARETARKQGRKSTEAREAFLTIDANLGQTIQTIIDKYLGPRA